MKHYDYIFSGAGLSALMTVYKMVQSQMFVSKSILLIDESPKKTNDRTWSFWEKPNGKFESIVSKKWKAALFADTHFERILDLAPYEYKMVKGIDFYNHVFDVISHEPNITFLNAKVLGFSEIENVVIAETADANYSCNKLLNSILFPDLVINQNKYPVLQQHFIGWFIKSAEFAFNPETVTFMDFSVEQKGNTRFMYVLPQSEKEALIEYTLFSKNGLPTAEYENAICDYIQKLGVHKYEILEKERGSIPMTSYPFWKHNTKNILNIGSAGGWTKASTGYTFKSSDKKSDLLILFLQRENDFTKFHRRNRFWFYDLLLLDILNKKNHLGSSIFSSLFQKGKPALILKFLDEKTSFREDLQVIYKCPKSLFLKALSNRTFWQ